MDIVIPVGGVSVDPARMIRSFGTAAYMQGDSCSRGGSDSVDGNSWSRDSTVAFRALIYASCTCFRERVCRNSPGSTSISALDRTPGTSCWIKGSIFPTTSTVPDLVGGDGVDADMA